MSEVSKLFFDDIAQKKMLSHSAKHKIGTKKWRKTGVKTPIDFLKGDDKKKYMGNSEISVSNIYDEVITYEKFLALDEAEKKKYLVQWFDVLHIPKKDVINKWTGHAGTLYYWNKKLFRKGEQKPMLKEKTTTIKTTPIDKNNSIFNIYFGGIFKGTDLAERILRISELLNNNGKYEIKFEVMETKE